MGFGQKGILIMTKSSKFIEYMKIHLISLNQDLEGDYNVQSKINIQGQIMATEHLLSVATDIMNDNLQGKGY
jgi:hypothetical protein